MLPLLYKKNHLMKLFALTALPLLVISGLFNPLAAEVRSTAENQSELSLTIYNGGRALVRDSRQLKLPAETNRVALMDVAEKIMPQTVAIEGLDVLEQNYDFDLLSPASLVQKNIGKKVRLARRSNETGETMEWSEGTILSTNGGIILKMADGSLESLQQANNYHMVFDDIPQNLRTSPTLSLLLKQATQGQKNIELTYLTTGLNWQSDYVLQLNDEENLASLDSWITLNNDSGISYNDAHLQLLAGDVNMQQPQMMRTMMEDNVKMRATMSTAVSQQALHGYHLYSIPHKTTINDKQSKQIKLFANKNIPVYKRLEDKSYVNSHGLDPEKSKPDQFLIFKNTKPELGIPLPQGTIRVYAKDTSGNKQFIGEDAIQHTAINEQLEIKLGKAFDISVERMTRKFHQLSKKQTQLSREIKVNNGSKLSQTVNISEIMPTQSWQIKNSSQPFSSPAPSMAEFTLTIAPLTELLVTYEVTISYP